MIKDQAKHTLTLNVNREDEEGLVYYKQDGQRFESNCTIKLNVETTYKFLITSRPPLKIKAASIKDSPLEVKEMVKDNEASPDSSTFCLLWTTHNVCISKRKARTRLPLTLTLPDGTLETMLQFKFYNSGDKGHSTWGNELHHIEYECVFKADMGMFDIKKETYR